MQRAAYRRASSLSWKLSLRGAWTAPNGSWTIAVYGNNVTDEEYNAFSAGGFLGNNYILGQPASWGAQLDYRF